MTTCEKVKLLIGDVLQLGDRTQHFNTSTLLMGSMPEFDSTAVILLITALEEHFGIMVEDDEISAETFETIGTLCDFVSQKLDA